MKLLRLLGASFLLSLRREIAFRANLVFQICLTVLNIASSFAVVSTVYTQTRTLGGWHLNEAIILLGTFQIVSGIFMTFVEPNVSWFSGQVRDGKLDSILIQPVSSLFMISLGKCEPLALSQVGMGLMVVGLGWHDGGTLPSWLGVLGWLILIGVGLVIAWASRVLIASVSLWVPSIELGVLYAAFWQFGRYPVAIYHQPLRFFLTYVLPFAFLATFPTSAMTGRTDLLLPLLGMAVGFVAVMIVQQVWKIGLRRYTSATS
jgi:ABC-2 type transport system permease protein